MVNTNINGQLSLLNLDPDSAKAASYKFYEVAEYIAELRFRRISPKSNFESVLACNTFKSIFI